VADLADESEGGAVSEVGTIGPGGTARRTRPSPADPSRRASERSPAVEELITTWSAEATDSIARVRDVSGPGTTRSRWSSPTAKKWKMPELTPIDIRNRTTNESVSIRPTLFKARCMDKARAQARWAWSGPS